jgi:catechol 2,3-dioxygenase-like lactoylglutathione lyase family enzyme
MPAASFTITGIERVSFAVQDLAAACRYATDWGLERAGGTDEAGVQFCTVDRSEVEFFAPQPGVPGRTPVGDASGISEVTWGVRGESDLAAIRDALSTDRSAEIDNDGVLRSSDDLGIALAFRVTQRQPVPFEPARFNAPGQPTRIDRRAARYQRARPHEISHLAIAVDDAGEAHRFYAERLGFRISDRYANRGIFMRASGEGNHHHLFLLNAKVPGTRFGHLAFKVRDIHEVIAGGQYFDAQGWSTFAGPGRHIVSSANFWYFQTPFGGSWEYAADEDMVTEAWEPQDFAAEAHIFSEWTFGLEKSDGTLKGPIAGSAARALDPDIPA